MIKTLFSFILVCSISMPLMGQRKKLSEVALAARIDKNIDDVLTKMKLAKAKPISDETFLRKIYLDIAGRIPTLDEARKFLNYKGENKREKLINFLQRSPGYVSHNFNYWADALRVLDRRPTITQSYAIFIKESLKKNTPYDVFVREMLSSQGSLYDYKSSAVNYYMRDRGMPLDNLSNTMSLSSEQTCLVSMSRPPI